MSSRSKATSTKARFVLCLSNGGYNTSLEPLKVYVSRPDADAARHDQVRVVDESGEDYLFPASLFTPVVLRGKARKAILAAYSEDAMDLAAARKALAEKGPSIPWKKLKAELHLQVAPHLIPCRPRLRRRVSNRLP